MGEFLFWALFAVIALILLMILVMTESKRESTRPVFIFICGFLSCLLAVLLSYDMFYYLIK